MPASTWCRAALEPGREQAAAGLTMKARQNRRNATVRTVIMISASVGRLMPAAPRHLRHSVGPMSDRGPCPCASSPPRGPRTPSFYWEGAVPRYSQDRQDGLISLALRAA